MPLRLNGGHGHLLTHSLHTLPDCLEKFFHPAIVWAAGARRSPSASPAENHMPTQAIQLHCYKGGAPILDFLIITSTKPAGSTVYALVIFFPSIMEVKFVLVGRQKSCVKRSL